MGNLFTNEKEKQFFKILGGRAESTEEMLALCRKAFTILAPELHVARMVRTLDAPLTPLRPRKTHEETVIYDNGNAAGEEPFVQTYVTGDKGNAIYSFFPEEGYTFTEEDREALEIAGSDIFTRLNDVMTFQLLEKTVVTDLACGIPNIRAFMGRVGEYLARGIHVQYAAMYFNIKGFKYVNKIYSYQEGDQVMRMYAQHVQSLLEPDEILARLGGDNYAALVRKEHVDQFLSQICHCKISYTNGEKETQFVLGATVGLAYLDNLHEPGEAMMRVSLALQAAKNSAKDVVLFDGNLYQDMMHAKEISMHFHQALSRHDFVVFFQPKVQVSDNRLCGGEALVRWVRDGQIVPPMEFVPILEREDLIRKLDFYVLDRTCEAIRRWQLNGLTPVRISVNFSKRHVSNANFVKEILDVVDTYGIDHSLIEVELTESEDYRDFQTLSGVVRQLAAAGIATSIDDFGTGYSSLNMLKETSFDIMKIDRSFIPEFSDGKEKNKYQNMFEGIVAISKAIGLETIVEGVETKEQLEYVKSTGCEMVQGYLFDKPLPEEQFTKRLVTGVYNL